MIGKCLENVRKKTPLVHNITNYVTVNDCANSVLAIGGSPIMADEIEEVCDITAVCTSLNLNIGTLNKNTIVAMLKAGEAAAEMGHPVVLDPVGAGASRLRTQAAREIVEKVKLSVIRGNASEIKALIGESENTKGVDADENDVVTEANMDSIIGVAKAFSKKTSAVIIITGAIDLVTDGEKVYLVKNGHAMMRRVTGTGCMLSAITAAFIGANGENVAEACLAAVCAMGVCGERAYAELRKEDGNASYRSKLIDELYKLSPKRLEEEAKYEVY